MPRTPSRCVPVDESVDNLLGALATGCPRPTFSPYSYRISILLCQFHGGEIVVVVASPETHLERVGNLDRCLALGKRIARNGCGARCIELLSRRLCHSGGWRGDRRRTHPAAPTRPCGDQEVRVNIRRPRDEKMHRHRRPPYLHPSLMRRHCLCGSPEH